MLYMQAGRDVTYYAKFMLNYAKLMLNVMWLQSEELSHGELVICLYHIIPGLQHSCNPDNEMCKPGLSSRHSPTNDRADLGSTHRHNTRCG